MKAFLKPLFSCKLKVLYKLAINMCWRGFWAMYKFEKRMSKDTSYFPAFIMLSLTNTEDSFRDAVHLLQSLERKNKPTFFLKLLQFNMNTFPHSVPLSAVTQKPKQ